MGKSLKVRLQTFTHSSPVQLYLQAFKAVSERRAYCLLTDIFVSHGKFVSMSNESESLRFILKGPAMLSSNTLRPEIKLKKKQRKTSRVSLVKLIKTNRNIFASSVK